MSGGADGKVETERKFEAGPDFTVPGLAGLPQVASVTAPETYMLDAVYFDTEDLRLFSARTTLRRRTGGTDSGWHLKLPAGTDSRREVHAPLGDEDTVPASLSEAAGDQTGGRPLRPIARLRTTRQVRQLLNGTGQSLAEVADDRVTGYVPDPDGNEGRPWAEVTAWREVEVELDTGTRDLLDAVGSALCEAGAHPAKAASKLAVVLAAAGAIPGAGT